MAEQSWAKHVADVLRGNGIRLFAPPSPITS
jgi:hypothetical protein